MLVNATRKFNSRCKTLFDARCETAWRCKSFTNKRSCSCCSVTTNECGECERAKVQSTGCVLNMAISLRSFLSKALDLNEKG